MFDHQRLDVYGIALDFVIAADDIVEQLPKGRFYRLARRSATESAAILDVCSRLGLIAEEHHSAASDLLHSIVSMLTRLAKNKGG